MDFFLKNSDSFACVLASHGSEVLEESVANPKVDCKVYHHVIYGTDRAIRTHLLLDLLDENRCKALQGKPKLFFVQVHVYVNRIFPLFVNHFLSIKTTPPPYIHQQTGV